MVQFKRLLPAEIKEQQRLEKEEAEGEDEEEESEEENENENEVEEEESEEEDEPEDKFDPKTTVFKPAEERPLRPSYFFLGSR